MKSNHADLNRRLDAIMDRVRDSARFAVKFPADLDVIRGHLSPAEVDELIAIGAELEHTNG